MTKPQLIFGKTPQLIFNSVNEFYRTLGQMCNESFCSITYETNSETGSYSDVYRIKILSNQNYLVPGMKKKCKNGNRINCHPYIEYLVEKFGFTLQNKTVYRDYNKVIKSTFFDINYLSDFQSGYNEVCYSKQNHITLKVPQTYTINRITSKQKRINEIKDFKLVRDINSPDFIISEDVTLYSPKPVEKKEAQISNGEKFFPRDKKIAQNALIRANYKCEIDTSHPSFISRRTNKTYTEPHHIIPLSYQDCFVNSLDVEANIISLCSNCHNEIHYGRDSGRIIEFIYKKRREELKDAGIFIELKDLLDLY